MRKLIAVLFAVAHRGRAGRAPEFELDHDHLFFPAELVVPRTPVRLLMINSDPTPKEFEN
jgi:hypothetical protein